MTGVDDEQADALVRTVPDLAEERVGCGFSVEDGPEFPLKADASYYASNDIIGLVMLSRVARPFRDLMVNPVAVALMRQMVSRDELVHWCSCAKVFPLDRVRERR